MRSSCCECSSVRQTRLGPHRDTQDAINRKSAPSSDHEKSYDRKYQQMELKSLALLSAGPVHEEAEGTMQSQNCNQHVHANSERRDSGEESEDEPQAPEELGRDRQEGQWSWNMQHASKHV